MMTCSLGQLRAIGAAEVHYLVLQRDFTIIPAMVKEHSS
jgi:hypothetical protein